jgi:hypothetical protein
LPGNQEDKEQWENALEERGKITEMENTMEIWDRLDYMVEQEKGEPFKSRSILLQAVQQCWQWAHRGGRNPRTPFGFVLNST